MAPDPSTAWHTSAYPATVWPMTPTDEQAASRVFTVDAAAAEAGVSRRSIYRLITAGELETVQARGVVGIVGRRITEASLRAYIKSRAGTHAVVREPTGQKPAKRASPPKKTEE